MSVFDYKRRKSSETDIAGVKIGADNPVIVQSMTNTSTNDVEGSTKQIIEIHEAGAPMVRLTAQGIKEVESLKQIKEQLKIKGLNIPIVADIHFNTMAAFAAAEVVDKVRINPGNFVDPGRVFKKIEYSENEYKEQLGLLADKVRPFFELCKKNGVAVRIGVNHGSLSDRIMSRFGNTPEGMVESALEFLRIARDVDFNNIVISIKSSNTIVMVSTVRLLVDKMNKEGFNFPLHLGVTEAGAGEDGRIKSAIGIGTLLADGIGDTIRVSLSEHPSNEIPVAREILKYIEDIKNAPVLTGDFHHNFNYIYPSRRETEAIGKVGGNNPVIVVTPSADDCTLSPQPEFTNVNEFLTLDTEEQWEDIIKKISDNPHVPILLKSSHRNRLGAVKSFIHRLTSEGYKTPIIVGFNYEAEPQKWRTQVRAAIEYGSLLIDGLIDGMAPDIKGMTPEERNRLSFDILQGSRSRITKTEYIACPGCGRTLFSLEPVLERVKNATSHLKGLKIGVMGCIVNGPGEMADADYGYVGAARGKVSLYRGIECVEKNIEEKEAVGKMIELLKKDGVWHEPGI